MVTTLASLRRPLRAIRLWWWLRHQRACEAPSGCSRPATACVCVLGHSYEVCDWHVEPLDSEDAFASLTFLSRFHYGSLACLRDGAAA